MSSRLAQPQPGGQAPAGGRCAVPTGLLGPIPLGPRSTHPPQQMRPRPQVAQSVPSVQATPAARPVRAGSPLIAHSPLVVQTRSMLQSPVVAHTPVVRLPPTVPVPPVAKPAPTVSRPKITTTLTATPQTPGGGNRLRASTGPGGDGNSRAALSPSCTTDSRLSPHTPPFRPRASTGPAKARVVSPLVREREQIVQIFGAVATTKAVHDCPMHAAAAADTDVIDCFRDLLVSGTFDSGLTPTSPRSQAGSQGASPVPGTPLAASPLSGSPGDLNSATWAPSSPIRSDSDYRKLIANLTRWHRCKCDYELNHRMLSTLVNGETAETAEIVRMLGTKLKSEVPVLRPLVRIVRPWRMTPWTLVEVDPSTQQAQAPSFLETDLRNMRVDLPDVRDTTLRQLEALKADADYACGQVQDHLNVVQQQFKGPAAALDEAEMYRSQKAPVDMNCLRPVYGDYLHLLVDLTVLEFNRYVFETVADLAEGGIAFVEAQRTKMQVATSHQIKVIQGPKTPEYQAYWEKETVRRHQDLDKESPALTWPKHFAPWVNQFHDLSDLSGMADFVNSL